MDIDTQTLDRMFEELIGTYMDAAYEMEPIFSLAEILQKRDMTSLRFLAEKLKIKKYYKLKKAILCDAIVKELSEPEGILKLFKYMDRGEWEYFNVVRAKKTHPMREIVHPASFSFLVEAALIQPFLTDEFLVLVVPDEIKEATKKLTRKGFLREMEERVTAKEYACAAAQLYGAIPIDELCEIIAIQNEQKIELDRLKALLDDIELYDDTFVVMGDEIAFKIPLLGGDEMIEEILEERRKRPRYLPPKEKFLEYSDFGFIEETSERNAFIEKVIEWDVEADKAIELSERLTHLFMADKFDGERIGQLFSEYGVEPDDIDKFNELLESMRHMANTTRLWVLNGNTPNDMFKEKASGSPMNIDGGDGLKH